MYELLWLLPALPLAGYLVLGLFGRRLGRGAVAAVGVGSIGLAAAIALGLAIRFWTAPPDGHSFTQVLWSWIGVSDLTPEIALTLDPLSLIMVLVITGVGFFIHLYSVEYMAGDEAFSRFFAYMNLFVSAMLVLVLADNLVLLYLGWEGVGLCSFLLIGFWYKERANADAARKAFVVTRVGDVAMALGLFLLLRELGTLRIAEILERAPQLWQEGSPVAIAAAALLLGGAVGKSAQLPLQTWLPDAMAGPTPVSALIHAATMVTAGVYLIARTHTLFLLAPPVLTAVAVIGALTLLLAGFAALAQRDIKRVLAYSTISQIGYMFLALGVGAWSAAMFHFMTHAFFKALLFLGAGAVILAVHHEQDIFKMGGLKQKIPGVFWTFVIGAAALAGLPLITAGFYSKDLILWEAFTSDFGSPWLWAAGLLGALLTALYSFRLVFLVFFGRARTEVEHPPGRTVMVPLVCLAVLSVVGGFVETPETLGHVTIFSGFMELALPASTAAHDVGLEALLQVLAALAFLAGLLLAYTLFLRRHEERMASQRLPAVPAPVESFWRGGWGFDTLYDVLLVRPVRWFARVNKADAVDRIYDGIAAGARLAYVAITPTHNGQLRWYATVVAIGTVLLVALVMLR